MWIDGVSGEGGGVIGCVLIVCIGGIMKRYIGVG